MRMRRNELSILGANKRMGGGVVIRLGPEGVEKPSFDRVALSAAGGTGPRREYPTA